MKMVQNASNQTQALALRQEIDKYMECAAKEEEKWIQEKRAFNKKTRMSTWKIGIRNSVNYGNLIEGENMDTLVSNTKHNGQKHEIHSSPGIDGQSGYNIVVTEVQRLAGIDGHSGYNIVVTESLSPYNEQLVSCRAYRNAGYRILVDGSPNMGETEHEVFEETATNSDTMDFGFVGSTMTWGDSVDSTEMGENTTKKEKKEQQKEKDQQKKKKKNSKKAQNENTDGIKPRRQMMNSLKYTRGSGIYAYAKKRREQKKLKDNNKPEPENSKSSFGTLHLLPLILFMLL